jgi:hypothetical protein
MTPPTSPPQTAPARKPKRYLVAFLLLIVGLFGLTGWLARGQDTPGSPRQHSDRTLFVNGHITADPSTFTRSYYAAHPYNRDGCAPDTGYRDLPGAEVTVADESGRTLAVANLDRGTFTDDLCSFAFTVTGVPAGRKFYQVTIGRRGTQTYTEAQLGAGPLDLTLR